MLHEPLIREGVPGIQMAEEMEHLARDLPPLASPLMDFGRIVRGALRGGGGAHAPR
ncbi:MAG: hypothetical protein ACR2J6_08870 [Thermoleophilaceae bacterium]